MEFEAYKNSILEGPGGEALQKLAASETGARLAARFGTPEAREAARRGDAEALGVLLRQVLSTSEGQAFAEQVKKAVGRHGQ